VSVVLHVALGYLFPLPVCLLLTASSTLCPLFSFCCDSGDADDPENAKSRSAGDRFIPTRGTELDQQMSLYLMSKDKSKDEDGENMGESNVEKNEHHKALQDGMLPQGSGGDAGHRVLAFKHKAPTPQGDTQANQRVLYSQNKGKSALVQAGRHIKSDPVRVLDAPDIMDDFYLNLIAWSSSNVLAVALGPTIYLWNAVTSEIAELMTLEDETDYIASVSWIQQGGTHLAVGTGSCQTQLWDVQALKQVRTMNGHAARVGSLAWNGHVVTSGSRDTCIVQHDVRVQQHNIGTFREHTQEVCGLEWSMDGLTLASGANDNTVCLWDARGGATVATPRHKLTDHCAAVKAIAWCPFERGLLATGGGTADRCIKFWNSETGSLLNSIDTQSQVCSAVWSRTSKEIVTSHGFSQYQLCLWSYPSMGKVKELTGHTSRILHTALSPDGQVIVSAAADETLRFWQVFPSASKSVKKVDKAMKLPGSRAMNLR
jgi:cell division cycle protein 20 (cofactor of APC complex)